ncbi:MAG: ribonuclease R [Bacilli bacterium]|nr:ribonuclease R [Bacilli bacterium]
MDIIEVLNDSKGLTIDELIAIFNEDISGALKQLEKEGRIFKNNKGKYISASKYHLYKYQVKRMFRYFAILVNEDNEEVKVELEDLNGAIYLDDVLYNEKEGYVFKVLEHHLNNLIGVYRHGYFYADDENFSERFKVINGNFKNDDKVVADGFIENNGLFKAKIKKVIGKSNDADSEARALIYQSEVPVEFDYHIDEELKMIGDEVDPKQLKNRRSYLDDCVVTIDGIDTKDIDDAISISKDNDLYHLKVHIADVSSYVKKDSYLDKEAIKRGTSIYLSKEVIPMLPKKLSNGICSLNEGVIRLTLTCDMKINTNGEVVDYDIVPSYIKSFKRLNYDDVNAYFNHEYQFDPRIEKSLDLALELSSILRKVKEERGELDLETKEAKIIYQNNKIVDIKLRKQGEGEKIIEDFMIIANETVASHYYYLDLPSIYRIHAPISEEKLTEFLRMIKPLGYHINAIQNGVHPHEIQRIINESKQKSDGDVVRNLLLRSLSKAKYSSDNIGHFGLASKNYTHFTSPIRRYPDLLLHRLIHYYLEHNNEYNPDLLAYIDELALSSSNYERRAINLERDELSLRLCEFMKGKEGEIYIGRISSMLRSGFFVELDNSVEGFVKFDSISNDFFTFDEQNMVIYSSKQILKLGDKVKVKLKGVSIRHQKIDFIYLRKIGGKKNGNY